MGDTLGEPEHSSAATPNNETNGAAANRAVAGKYIIPQDVVNIIVWYLHTPAELYNYALVCSRFARCVRERPALYSYFGELRVFLSGDLNNSCVTLLFIPILNGKAHGRSRGFQCSSRELVPRKEIKAGKHEFSWPFFNSTKEFNQLAFPLPNLIDVTDSWNRVPGAELANWFDCESLNLSLKKPQEKESRKQKRKPTKADRRSSLDYSSSESSRSTEDDRPQVMHNLRDKMKLSWWMEHFWKRGKLQGCAVAFNYQHNPPHCDLSSLRSQLGSFLELPWLIDCMGEYPNYNGEEGKTRYDFIKHHVDICETAQYDDGLRHGLTATFHKHSSHTVWEYQRGTNIAKRTKGLNKEGKIIYSTRHLIASPSPLAPQRFGMIRMQIESPPTTRDGEEEQWANTGTKIYSVFHVKDLKHGEEQTWNGESGIKTGSEWFEQGRKHSVARNWDGETGVLTYECEWKGGLQHGLRKIYDNHTGQLISSVKMVHGFEKGSRAAQKAALNNHEEQNSKRTVS